jgi:hypothetical protein
MKQGDERRSEYGQEDESEVCPNPYSQTKKED